MKRVTTLIALAAILGACTTDIPRITLHLRRPVDLAVICMEGPKGVPVADCANGKNTLMAFIINAERGSVARLDLRTGEFLDDDKFIPGFTPLPVGTRPASIIASVDGTAVYMANAAALAVTRIDVATLEATEQALPSAPADLIQVGDELLVALPDAATVARIPTEGFGALTTLDQVPLPGGSPFDLVATAEGTVLYVGHADVAYVSVVDLTTGTETTIALADPPAQASAAAASISLPDSRDLPRCMNGEDDDKDGKTDFLEDPQCYGPTTSLEADVPRAVLTRLALAPAEDFLYAVNVRDRTLVVIDTAKAERLDVNAEEQPGANDLFRRLGRKDIHLLGIPIDVTMATVETTTEDGATVTQLLAYVSSATGVVFVFDVQDTEGHHVHRERDGDAQTVSKLFQPELFSGNDKLELGLNRRKDQPSFGEFISDLSVGDKTLHYGIELAEDDRIVLNESWSFTYGGVFLARAAPLGAVESGTGRFVTPEAVFCTSGVEEGDRLVLHYKPTAVGCEAYDGDSFAWTISAVNEHGLTLTAGSGVVLEGGDPGLTEPAAVPDPTAECFKEAMAYEVRVPDGIYAVIGSTSGYLHPWIAQDDGTCAPDPEADPRFVGRTAEWTLKPGESLATCPPPDADADAAFEGELFQNHAMTLRIIPGCAAQDGVVQVLETERDIRWRVTVNSSFAPRAIGGRTGEPTMGIPSSLRWSSAAGKLYVVDSGQEKVLEIIAGDDVIGTTFF